MDGDVVEKAVLLEFVKRLAGVDIPQRRRMRFRN
jgi:hypothetical protein